MKKAIVWSELNRWPPDQSCYASGCGICLTLRPRAQEDRADRPTGPGACSALTRCSLLFSTLRYTLLCQQTRHLLLQTSLRSVLSLLSCRNSHQIASLSLCELEILNDKAGKSEVPESHVVRFLSCRPSRIYEGRYFHVQTENVFEYFGVLFFKPFHKIFVQQIVFPLCNRQS